MSLCLAASGSPDGSPIAPGLTLAWAETKGERDARMAWWREARFGMFIHWGPYAVLGGVWNGQSVPGDSVFAQRNGRIPVADYAAVAARFQPVKFDADRWVRLAKAAGMKYLVVTTKHHDGFAMWPSDVSSYNIRDHAKFDRDPIAELSAACRRHGLRLGFYYSQARDWHHAGGGLAPRDMRPWDKAQEGSYPAYVRKIAIPQVRELLTHYGPIAVMWWDTPDNMTPQLAAELRELLKLQPGIIANDRLINGHPYHGDFSTAEKYLPPGRDGTAPDWEACDTMNDSWGYTASDHNWKSTTELIRKLLSVAGKGGNLLLNVGPDAAGEIPAASVECLHAMGAWLEKNGEAVYGSTAGPFRHLPRAGATQKPGKLYYHIFEWPDSRRLLIPISNQVRKAYALVAPEQPLTATPGVHGVTIELPSEAPSPHASIIVLEIARPAAAIEQGIKADRQGIFHLTVREAELHGRQLHLSNGIIEEWPLRGTNYVGWPVYVAEPGRYCVEVTYACEPAEAGGTFELRVGAQNLFGRVIATGPDFKAHPVGETIFGRPGTVEIALQPALESRKMKLHSVTLTPIRP